MSIIPDPTLILLQSVPFLVTVFVVYKLLFGPMLAYLEERDEAIEGGRRDARELQARIQERMSEYDVRLEEAHREMADLRAARRAVALEKHGVIVQQAREEAEGQVAEAVQSIQVEAQAARAQLKDSADSFAGQIAGRVLGRALAR